MLIHKWCVLGNQVEVNHKSQMEMQRNFIDCWKKLNNLCIIFKLVLHSQVIAHKVRIIMEQQVL